MTPPAPLDFGQTLELLDAWKGRVVSVHSYAAQPGQPMSHTGLVMEGMLGAVQMVDNQIDPNVASVASYPVGPARGNGIYLSPGDHRLTQPLPGPDGEQSIRIDFLSGFAVQVDLVD